MEYTNIWKDGEKMTACESIEDAAGAIKSIREIGAFGETAVPAVITKVTVRECESKEDKTKFNMVDYELKTAAGKSVRKSFSVDFLRKVLNQLGVKAADLVGKVMIITVKDRFKQVGLFVPLAVSADGFCPIQYQDEEETESLKKLADLGL